MFIRLVVPVPHCCTINSPHKIPAYEQYKDKESKFWQYKITHHNQIPGYMLDKEAKSEELANCDGSPAKWIDYKGWAQLQYL